MYADDLKWAAGRLRQLSGMVVVPPYVVTFVAGFLGDRNGVATADVEAALREMVPSLAIDARRASAADRRAARAMGRPS